MPALSAGVTISGRVAVERESLLRVRRCRGCWETRTKERASPGLRLLIYCYTAAACSVPPRSGMGRWDTGAEGVPEPIVTVG